MPWENARKDPAYGTAAWKKARAACLKRARWRCELKYDGCIGAASEADHEYGIASDPQHQHLKAACTPCHKKKTAQQSADARRGGSRSSDPAPTSRIVFDPQADTPPY